MLRESRRWDEAIWDPARAAVGFELPQPLNDFFSRVFSVSRGRSVDAEFWRNQVQDGLRAVSYHVGNMAAFEDAILEIARAGLERVETPRPGMIHQGHVLQRLTYEEQALLFAIHRTLDYLAKAELDLLSALPSRNEQIHFGSRPFLEKLQTGTPPEVGAQLARMTRTFASANSELLRRGRRNIVAHEESLRAGELTIVGNAQGGIGLVLNAGGFVVFRQTVANRSEDVARIPPGAVELVDPASRPARDTFTAVVEHVRSVYQELLGAFE